MSYWYEPKKEDIEVGEEDINIYLGVDPAWDDCGNIYVRVSRKDMVQAIEEKKKSEEKLVADMCEDCKIGGCKTCKGTGKCLHNHLPKSKGGMRF